MTQSPPLDASPVSDDEPGRTQETEPRLAEDVYRRVRSDVVHGAFRPNERLVEADLARRLGASRTPVRESLQRLEQEGLVDSTRHGWVVHDHTIAEIEEIYEVRLALEGYAARLAATRATGDEVQALLDQFARDGGFSEVTSFADASKQNTAFHDAVTRAAGNSRLHELIQRSRNYAFNEKLGRLYTRAELRTSGEGHQRMLVAIRDRDPEAAEKIAREHVEQAFAIIQERLG
jgi:DNA-binding GntR family transcriptional regulator